MKKFVLMVFLMTAVSLTTAVSYSQSVTVKVDASKHISKITPYLYGLNVARWDEDLFPGPAKDMLLDCDRDAIRKVIAGGFTVLKYPGGNDADHYIWNSPDNSAGDMNTDEYAALLNAVGAQGFITINFNESPELAADWVRYCNKEKGYDIKYWEVGDEQWGVWARGHTTPEKYAARFIEFVKAMKAADPTIKIAANVNPTDNIDGWTCRVMKAAGSYIDMVTFSYYPFSNKDENADSLLASIPKYRHAYETIRHALEETLPKAKADSMWIIDVGYNSISGRPGPITISMANALWVADMVGTMAEMGEQMSCYWALHNSYPPGGGDYGLLTEDGKNMPRLNYYVFPIYTRLFGREVVQSSSSDPLLSAYASTFGDDTLSVILINKDKRNTKRVSLKMSGFEPEGSASAWLFNTRHKLDRIANRRIAGPSLEEQVPPYSIIVLQLLRKGVVLPPRNLALHAKASASTSAKNGPDFGPSSAVDGISYTRWASAALWGAKKALDRQWFQIDLGKSREFDKIVIRWATGFGIDYKLLASRDGKKWETLFREGDGHGGVEKIDFKPVNARFVKLVGSKGSYAISSYSIYEFQIFNSQNSQ